MIEIKFTGGPGNIHQSIQSYLDQAGVPHKSLPSPLVHYKGIDSNTDQYQHIVTMLGQFPLACTCSWFRHHPGSAKRCTHMTEAEEEARDAV